MKRIIVVVLCLCILVSGCSSRAAQEGDDISETGDEAAKDSTDKQTGKDSTGKGAGGDSNSKEDVAQGSSSEDNDDKIITDGGKAAGNEDNASGEDMSGADQAEQRKPVGVITSFKLNGEWTKLETAKNQLSELVIPEYEARVDAYHIAEDLSNIENINQFSGFTKTQIKSLAENGFVVLPSKSTRMHYIYDSNEYEGIPNFITADSVLHTYHQFYDKSLTGIELGYLYDDLELLCRQMLVHSIRLSQTLEDEKLIALQERNIIFFLVAGMLMAGSTEIQEIAGNYLIEEERPVIPDELYETAAHEYTMINEAGGIALSDYFGFDFDYSQFKVRGHYTKSEELGRFFKTMMWYGTAPIPFFDEEGNYLPDNVLQSLLIAHTTFLDSDGICSAELWSRIYKPTSAYVGISDDLDVFAVNNLRKTVFGDNEDPNVLNDNEYKNRLLEEVKKLPEPRIQADYVTLSTPTGKQFRFMGQRYIMDSYMLQELTDSILRPIPSSLDVMGILGSSTAKNLLLNHYKPQEQWPGYESKYNKLYAEVTEYGIDTWANNLYNGWVWSIKEALTEYDSSSGMPLFMTNDAWKYKSLNTALGSYTELKHDSVLYGKQSGAEAGGNIYYADYHYVEPNIPLYCKLLFLTDNTVSVLNEQGMMNPKLNEGAELFKEVLKLLISCSLKELKNEMLSEEEYDALLSYGGRIERISQLFLEGITGSSFSDWDLTDMLATDIATCKSEYLSLGTGYFDEIYVVMPVGDKLYISRGPVYSHYEFVSDVRLTDEEWWALQGIEIVKGEYHEYPQYTEPSKNLPVQPFWTGYFKSDSNNVETKSLEVVWGNMVQ